MGWGVQHITLADNGRVSYSNPVRQSLFTFEDCKGGGFFKAEAAAAALCAVYPGVRSAGHVLTIPMPGHPLASGAEAAKAKRDAETLEALVSSHDVVFVLTDSRESRWLPTLLAAKHDKVCVNAALGLDSFLVVRHGGAPDGAPSEEGPDAAAAARAKELDTAASEGGESDPDAVSVVENSAAAAAAVADVEPAPRLGCYFCTDVVAPENSSLNRTLDQQCTVTRPGLAPMAAATAVEMTVGLLHHPLRQRAPADDSAGRAKGLGAAQAAAAAGQGRHPLGALPHQVLCCSTYHKCVARAFVCWGERSFAVLLGVVRLQVPRPSFVQYPKAPSAFFLCLMYPLLTPPVPAKVRGFIASFTTVTPSALAFDRCTACSAAVVDAHKSQGWEFVEKACLSPQFLEEVSGLEELRR